MEGMLQDMQRAREGVVDDAGAAVPELRDPLDVDDPWQCSLTLQIFHDACGEGHLDFVRAMVEGGVAPPEFVHACEDFAFRLACGDGRWHVAQYLVSLGGVDVHANDDAAFLSACEEGRLDIAQWLLVAAGGTPFDRRHAADALWWACRGRHAALLQWLQAMWGPAVVRMSFLDLCRRGDVADAQWLYTSLQDSDAVLIAKEAVQIACTAKRVALLQWLSTLAAMRRELESGRVDLLTECCEELSRQAASLRESTCGVAEWTLSSMTRTAAVITWLLEWGPKE
jgi:hypothetical protein